jgi:hypothetical protein
MGIEREMTIVTPEDSPLASRGGFLKRPGTAPLRSSLRFGLLLPPLLGLLLELGLLSSYLSGVLGSTLLGDAA